MGPTFDNEFNQYPKVSDLKHELQKIPGKPNNIGTNMQFKHLGFLQIDFKHL